MYWYIIFVIVLLIGIITTIGASRRDILNLSTFHIVSMILSWGFAIIIVLYLICTPLEFKKFAAKYKLQEEMYNSVSIKDDYVATASIIEINQELFDYQASKRTYGNWSLVPARVLNMEPIGIR